MTAEVTIFRPACADAQDVTDTYLRITQHRRAVVAVDIGAAAYRTLGPIAAKQGMTISTFINRLCLAAIEAAPGPVEVPFSG